MKRWYDEIPALKNAFPDLAIMSCHDECCCPRCLTWDGLLVGYGNMAPELLLEFLKAGKAQDYTLARKYHEQLLPLTHAVLSPRLAHGRHGCPEARPARPAASSTT